MEVVAIAVAAIAVVAIAGAAIAMVVAVIVDHKSPKTGRASRVE